MVWIIAIIAVIVVLVIFGSVASANDKKKNPESYSRADEMLMNCKAKGYARGVKDEDALGYFVAIAKQFEADEKIVLSILAWFDGIGDDCAYVFTNRRLLWKGKKKELGIINIDDITSASFSVTKMYGSELSIITLNSYAKDVMIGNIRETAAKIYEEIKRQLNIKIVAR